MVAGTTQLPLYLNGISNSRMIHSTNGRFYTGMSREDARKVGAEKNTFRRDFNNVDKNKDNVLTNDEILLERELEANRLKWDVAILSIFGLDDAYRAITQKGKGRIFNVLFAGLFAGLAVSTVSRKKRMDETNDRLRRELSEPVKPVDISAEYNKLDMKA